MLRILVLSTTLSCFAVADKNGFLASDTRATNVSKPGATIAFTEGTSIRLGVTWSDLEGPVSDQISSWEKTFQKDTDKLLAMKIWINTAAEIVTDYKYGQKSFGDVIKEQAIKHFPQVVKKVTGSPLLSYGATAFVSFFQKSEGQKLEELRKQIMKEVRKTVEASRFTEQLDEAREGISAIMSEINAFPSYAADPPADAGKDWPKTRKNFWMIRENSFNNLRNHVFSPSCVNNAVTGPRPNPSSEDKKVCEKFQGSGALAFQVPFALTHITILLQLAHFEDVNATREEYIGRAQTMARNYYALLKDSLDSYGKLGAAAIPGCQWSFDTTQYYGCHKSQAQACALLGKAGCATCKGNLAHDTDPNTGLSISQAMGCQSSVYDHTTKKHKAFYADKNMDICTHNIKRRLSFKDSKKECDLDCLICRFACTTKYMNDKCENHKDCVACQKACGPKPKPVPVGPTNHLCNKNDFADYKVRWQKELHATYDGILKDIHSLASAR